MRLRINGKDVEAAAGTNLVEAAKSVGVEIPVFCYHAKLSIAAQCRMCLVEVEKMPKLVPACQTPVAEGMVVKTDSERVKTAQAGVMEFLLLNHPVDCPICDQAGECRLQDYYMVYDLSGSRSTIGKVHKPKVQDIGGGVVLDSERCVVCTRCVRYFDEITGEAQMGTFNRGDRVEVSIFPDAPLHGDYCGNVVDLCPVGALTWKDFRFKCRVWLLEKTPSVCPGCARGCNVTVEHHEGRVFRLKPRDDAQMIYREPQRAEPYASTSPHAGAIVRDAVGGVHEAVNQCWMCDEGRGSYKFVNEGRLVDPVVREKENATTETQRKDEEGGEEKGVRKEGAGVGAGAGAGAGAEKRSTAKAPRTPRSERENVSSVPFGALGVLAVKSFLTGAGAVAGSGSGAVADAGADAGAGSGAGAVAGAVADADAVADAGAGGGRRRAEVTTWERALSVAAEQLQEVVSKRGGSGVGVVLSPQATLEDNRAMVRFAADHLGATAFYIGGRRDGEGDSFLRMADKNPNRAGVLAALESGATARGLMARDANQLTSDVAAGKLAALIVMGHELPLGADAFGQLVAAMSRLDVVVVLASNRSVLVDAATVALPAASFAEKDGTFVNALGMHQKLRRGVALVGRALPETQIVQKLALKMGFDFRPAREAPATSSSAATPGVL